MHMSVIHTIREKIKFKMIASHVTINIYLISRESEDVRRKSK